MLKVKIEKTKTKSSKNTVIQDKIMKYIKQKKLENNELLNEIKKNFNIQNIVKKNG